MRYISAYFAEYQLYSKPAGHLETFFDSHCKRSPVVHQELMTMSTTWALEEPLRGLHLTPRMFVLSLKTSTSARYTTNWRIKLCMYPRSWHVIRRTWERFMIGLVNRLRSSKGCWIAWTCLLLLKRLKRPEQPEQAGYVEHWNFSN